jgi:SPP1 gp7 family putative phage head morphogenesis protein
MAKKTTVNNSESKGIVINQLVVRPNNRSVTDIDSWRSALKAADKGKRAKLYDLYEDLLLDNVLSSAIEKRIMAITNADLAFTRNDTNEPEIDTLMDTPEFEEILTEIMNVKFWGKTVMELDFTNGLKGFNIPRKHIRTDLGVIVKNENDEFGFPYRNDDFFLEVGNDKNLGLILKAAPFAIYKRGGFNDWAQFVELFGMPDRIGKYDMGDDETRRILTDLFTNAGSARWAVVPKSADIETKDDSSYTANSLYKDFKNACNEEILIGILGQTMTTQNGSSKSQSETHKEVEEGINKSDRRFVQRVLNKELLPRLEKRGFPVSGGFFYFPEAGENLKTGERLEIDIKLKNEIGIDIDDDYFYETYGVPKPKGKVSRKQEAKPASEEVKQSGPSPEQLSFWERVLSFFDPAPGKGAKINHSCPTCGGIHQSNLADNLGEFNTEALLRRVVAGEASYFDAELYTFTANALKDGLTKGFAAKKFIDFEYGFEPDALKTAMELNLFHFSAAKTLTQVQKLNELWRGSTSFEDFRKKAEGVTEVFNKTWLQTEYETAYLTAESSALFHRLAQQTDIFPYWEYRTVGDNKVRPEHRTLNGLILPANDPRWNKIWPPNGWKCRCYIVPRMASEVDVSKFAENRKTVDEYFKTPEWKKNAAQGFDVNRAILGQVFTKNQMYINKFPDKASKLLKNLFYNDWGLDEIGKRMAKATDLFTPYAGTADKWFKANAKKGLITFNDYQNRSVFMTEKTFKKHTLGKKADRVEYLNSLKDIIANPDEVWLNDYIKGRYDNFVLIKYYKDYALAAICRVNEGKVYEVNTWFKIAVESKVKDKLHNPRWMYRRGLLIKNKE